MQTHSQTISMNRIYFYNSQILCQQIIYPAFLSIIYIVTVILDRTERNAFESQPLCCCGKQCRTENAQTGHQHNIFSVRHCLPRTT